MQQHYLSIGNGFAIEERRYKNAADRRRAMKMLARRKPECHNLFTWPDSYEETRLIWGVYFTRPMSDKEKALLERKGYNFLTLVRPEN